jgi:hypothetical protein
VRLFRRRRSVAHCSCQKRRLSSRGVNAAGRVVDGASRSRNGPRARCLHAVRGSSLAAPGWDVSLVDDVTAAPARLPPSLLPDHFCRVHRRVRLVLLGRAPGRLESRYWFRNRGGAVVAQVVGQLLTCGIRRAGCATRGPGPSCWRVGSRRSASTWRGRMPPAWPLASFARWSGQKWRATRNRWAVACTTRGGLASSVRSRSA